MEASGVNIVVNPAAGSGKAGRIAGPVLQKFRDHFGHRVKLIYTGKKNDATFITRESIEKGASLIVSVGGDGTLNEVVNGFFNEKIPVNPKCALGIICCGTGRGFGNGIGLPESVGEQVDNIINGDELLIDAGYISFTASSGKTEGRYFINECQSGIGSRVASSVGSNFKILGGKIAFGLSATITALFMRPLPMTLHFDEEKGERYNLIGIVAGNGTECAGGMKLTPDALLNDNLFDILLIRDMNILFRLLNLSKVYTGKHILSQYFEVRRCKELRVSSENKIDVETDGEVVGTTPYELKIIPSVVRLRTKTSLTKNHVFTI